MTVAELCVKRPVFAVMLISFLLVLGIFSFRDLGVDLFPKADAPVVFVSVRLRGATPEEVTCQFVLERDIESAAQDVREKVAAAVRNLPTNIDPPVIIKADPDSDPVLA